MVIQVSTDHAAREARQSALVATGQRKRPGEAGDLNLYPGQLVDVYIGKQRGVVTGEPLPDAKSGKRE